MKASRQYYVAVIHELLWVGEAFSVQPGWLSFLLTVLFPRCVVVHRVRGVVVSSSPRLQLTNTRAADCFRQLRTKRALGVV